MVRLCGRQRSGSVLVENVAGLAVKLPRTYRQIFPSRQPTLLSSRHGVHIAATNAQILLPLNRSPCFDTLDPRNYGIYTA